MAEYSLGFSRHLNEAAWSILNYDVSEIDAKRTVLYLSKLSCEITLKHILESAGFAISEIRDMGHELAALYDKCAHITFEKEIAPGCTTKMSGAEVGVLVLDTRFGNAVTGTILDGEKEGASRYPNQVRYGSKLKDYPLEFVLQTATQLYEWAMENVKTVARRDAK